MPSHLAFIISTKSAVFTIPFSTLYNYSPSVKYISKLEGIFPKSYHALEGNII
nr:MAG TPA: hypothetical protein [Bacteriophage sp.]